MKILAIRGENLASLAGSFEVDLAQPPLGEAGLLLIGGPTGSGKSTLLDAVCLALFDRTPRLGGRGSAVQFLHEHDREVLTSGDPRCLLRRGAVEAYAEVDFRGQDGARWRARWSVRRARRRLEGRIQTQQLSLECVDSGEVRGGTKTQTLDAIEALLGLDYSAFCRAVLLAQGEFASFLRARPDERAGLLERITGTTLYRDLSVAAHQRSGEERQRLALIETRLDSLQILSAEERAELEAGRAEERAALEAAHKQVRAAEDAQRWHARLRELVGREAAALRERAELEAISGELPAREEELEATARALAMTEVVKAVDRSQALRAEAEAQVLLQEERAAASAAAVSAAERDSSAASGRVAAVRERADALRGPIETARALDVELARAVDAQQRAAARAAKAEGELAQARALQIARERESAARMVERDAAQEWLEAHCDDAPLAAQWPRWEALFARAVALLSEREGLLAQRPEVQAAVQRAEERKANAEAAAHKAEDLLLISERREEALREEVEAALGGREAEQVKQVLDERRVTLAELRGVLQRAARAQGTHGAAQLEERAARDEVESAAAEAAACEAAAERTQAAADEAARGLDKAKVALGLEERRHALRDGEPCPLCGACAHPYAEQLPPFSQLVRDLEERARELRAEHGEQREAGQAARMRGDMARTTALAARQRAVAAEVERAEAEEVWLDLGFKLGWQVGQELPSPWEPEAVEVLEEISAQTESRLTEVRELQGRESELSLRLAALRRAHAGAQERLAEARRTLAEASHRLALLEQRLFDQVHGERRLRAELAEAFPGGERWDELAVDPEGFVDRCRELQASYAERDRRRREAEAALTTALAEAGPAKARIAELAAAWVDAKAEAAATGGVSQDLGEQRAALLGGRPAHLVEAELAAEEQAAREGEQGARSALAAAREEAATCVARLESAREQAERVRRAAGEAEATLLGALANGDQALELVRMRIARGDAWLRRERDELRRLAMRRVELDKAVEVYGLQRAEHLSPGRPELDEAEAERGFAEASAEARARERALLGIEARLTADERAARTSDELRLARDEQRERSELWEVMGDLIGSHDGKKFRIFAQSLTLELLLARANHTLEELAPRYRLQRVAGRDLDLQVADLDMAGEVRPVSSLSGGEGFLLSLALALGLSSLSARDARVESLFVDEGFGTLDPESQEVALATLDALQASGRQVVLISHVPGLRERIGAGVRVVPQGQGSSRVLAVSA